MSNIYLVTISFNKSKQFLFKNYDTAWHLLWQFAASSYKNGNILNKNF